MVGTHGRDVLAGQILMELNDWTVATSTQVRLCLVSSQEHIWRITSLDQFTQPRFALTTILDY